jgi:hypothetical protein
MKKKKITIKKIEIIIGLILFIMFAVLISQALQSFYSENERFITHYKTTTENPDHIEVMATVKAIDPIKGDIEMRLTFEPHGNLIDKYFLLTRNIYFYVNNASGEQELIYRKGKTMYPLDITLNLYDGLVTDYPFDNYKTELFIDLEAREINENENPEDEEKHIILETAMNFTGSVSGYNIRTVENNEGVLEYSVLDIEISRSASVIFFSVFVMLAMWSLTILTILLVLSVLTRKRKVEISMFAFTSALMFALPALRNMQPLAPPIGTFSDYVAFFWAESIAALALITLIITWLRRPPKEI